MFKHGFKSSWEIPVIQGSHTPRQITVKIRIVQWVLPISFLLLALVIMYSHAAQLSDKNRSTTNVRPEAMRVVWSSDVISYASLSCAAVLD